MRAHAELSINADGRLGRVVSAPPVAFRAAGDEVYMVGTAAGPLGDDQITVTVDVADGATLRLRSAAATIVYQGTSSHQQFEVTVGRAATLDWHPEPLVATAGCHHTQHSVVTLAEGAELDWTEEVVLGRHGEGPGWIDFHLDVDLVDAGFVSHPLLRHQVTVGDPGWDGPAVLAGFRTTGLRVIVRQGWDGPPEPCGEGWAWMALAGSGWLLAAVGDDLPQLQARMAAADPTPVLAAVPG